MDALHIRRVNNAPTIARELAVVGAPIQIHARQVTPIFHLTVHFHGQQMKIKVFMAAFRYMHHNAPLVDHWISGVIDVASAGAMDRLAVQPGRATLYTSCPSVQLDTLLKTLPKIR